MSAIRWREINNFHSLSRESNYGQQDPLERQNIQWLLISNSFYEDSNCPYHRLIMLTLHFNSTFEVHTLSVISSSSAPKHCKNSKAKQSWILDSCFKVFKIVCRKAVIFHYLLRLNPEKTVQKPHQYNNEKFMNNWKSMWCKFAIWWKFCGACKSMPVEMGI